MEDTLKAMLFSDTIMYRISGKEYIEYSSTSPGVAAVAESTVSHHCDDAVWIAVYSLIKANEIEISECIDDIINHPVIVMDEVFAQLAIGAAPLYFPVGYTPETFLGYCAMVMGVGLQMVKNGRDSKILESASSAVSTVLIGFMLSNEFQEKGGFGELIVTCTLFNHAFAKAKLEKLKKERNEEKKSKS